MLHFVVLQPRLGACLSSSGEFDDQRLMPTGACENRQIPDHDQKVSLLIVMSTRIEIARHLLWCVCNKMIDVELTAEALPRTDSG